ncbi:MAG TPA: phenylalanine--tRNA ligase subunit alpha [Candidatus Ratteibacteria bacterium]|nr:phenylalanine--tRNA ligase subunit alpha [bacterium]HON05167.1 phenylalanine--tRNA ligase subunit alpha [bacterium]HRS06960.1 phenylalanine--tRNA ligase subunit alpha [Candidatus Ratteibacteria bacterium]HRV04323.1 phenylalanine--tRNA ligase subunit alpha [Candidatus Ratteibacteria bacterium]
MLENLDNIVKQAICELQKINDHTAIEQWRVKYFGRKGLFADITSAIPHISPELRSETGKKINTAKKQLMQMFEEKLGFLKNKEASDTDVNFTIPGIIPDVPNLHPITLVSREIVGIFQKLGFGIHVGPEIETDFYNFEALNMPENHPARDMWDTFYLDEDRKLLLRTHTSPVQVRVMQKLSPPLRIIAIGKTFRRDAFDASHSPVFHQVEGLMVDKNITFSNLKAVLIFFLRELFGSRVRVRFLPSYFPFTEPSAEISISCVICGGKGCQTCGNAGWLEILGAGMVHPEVFRKSGLDCKNITGFAFGAGIERIAMLKYGIDDIRQFYLNDKRFIQQFG